MEGEGEGERAPPHPGRVLGLELERLGLSVTEAAERLFVTRPTLSKLVNGRQSVSPEMALKLGRFLGDGAGRWLTMQTRYDLWRVQHDGEACRRAARVTPLSPR